MAPRARNGKGKERLSGQVSALLAQRLSARIADPIAAAASREAASAKLEPSLRTAVDAVIDYDSPSYREALLIQAAYGLCEPGLDLRMRQGGGRGVAKAFALLLKKEHIRATADAFQNIGKNVVNLVRGNVIEFDHLLQWLAQAHTVEIKALYDYTIAGLALKARPVLPMPDLVPAKLSFFNVTRLLEALLNQPSGGAHEQFAVAACLEALVEEFGLGGIAGLRVETKPITASDASSKVAGDIQVKRGNRTEEAIEVSASDWRLKLDQAVAAIRTADLPRAHILANVREGAIGASSELGRIGADVSIIDVRAFLRVLVAVMRKPARAAALNRLHELLERNQPNIDLVNDYVALLKQRDVVS